VNVLGLNVYAWRLQAEMQQKQSLIEETVKSTFPQLTVVREPELQMQAEINRLQISRGVRSEQALTTQLAQLQTTQSGVSLDRLRYENGVLLDGAEASPSSPPSGASIPSMAPSVSSANSAPSPGN
jgi:general secretion pathway protein L